MRYATRGRINRVLGIVLITSTVFFASWGVMKIVTETLDSMNRIRDTLGVDRVEWRR